MRVIRIFLAFLSALALALSPVAAASAATAPVSMADCDMKCDMPADESSMDCCGPACPAPAPAAVEPERSGSTTDLSWKGLNATLPVKALYSLLPTGLDPPPRLLS